MTCCGDLVCHARQPPPSRWVGGSGTVKEVMCMATFWTKLLKSPSLPGIVAVVVLTIIEAVLDDE